MSVTDYEFYRNYDFNGNVVDILKSEGVILFEMVSCSKALNYTNVHGLTHHAYDECMSTVFGGLEYLTLDDIKTISIRKSRRGKLFKDFAEWAEKTVSHINMKNDRFDKRDKNITESAKLLGMSAKDLANWLSKNHCSGRYSSNGSIYWINWFVDEGYGAYPILHNSVDGTNRVSRVPVLTASGIEYVKNILEHQREHGVLAFAEVDNEVADRLLDNKIVKAFQDYRLNNLSLSDDYFISIDNLTTIVKKLIKEEA